MTSRICTTNNCFKRSKKKLCFSENFCWIFLGTIHGSHRESKLGLERLKKWGFAWILKKIQFRKEKGMTPYWPPVPTSRGTNQPERFYRGREPIKNRIDCSKRNCRHCEVLHSTAVQSFSFQDKGREIDPRHVREIGKKSMYTFGWESFPKLLVLLDKMHTGM